MVTLWLDEEAFLASLISTFISLPCKRLWRNASMKMNSIAFPNLISACNNNNNNYWGLQHCNSSCFVWRKTATTTTTHNQSNNNNNKKQTKTIQIATRRLIGQGLFLVIVKYQERQYQGVRQCWEWIITQLQLAPPHRPLLHFSFLQTPPCPQSNMILGQHWARFTVFFNTIQWWGFTANPSK